MSLQTRTPSTDTLASRAKVAVVVPMLAQVVVLVVYWLLLLKLYLLELLIL